MTLLTILAIGALLFAAWAFSRQARVRADQAQQMAREAYQQGLLDAAEARARRPPRPRAGPTDRASTAPDEPAAYWSRPPIEIADAEAIRRVLSGLDGRPPAICFTGWPREFEPALEQRARDAGFTVHPSVVKRLSFLCVGETPGPAKLKKALEQGVAILSGEQLQQLIRDGWDNA